MLLKHNLITLELRNIKINIFPSARIVQLAKTKAITHFCSWVTYITSSTRKGTSEFNTGDYPAIMDCRLCFHFRVAVHLFFRSSAPAKRFTWKWLDSHENERTGKTLATEVKVNLALAYSSMSRHRGPLIWPTRQPSWTAILFKRALLQNEEEPCRAKTL